MEDKTMHTEDRIMKWALGGSFTENIETTASGYFGENELPTLAEEKCIPDQVRMCFEAIRVMEKNGERGWTVRFD